MSDIHPTEAQVFPVRAEIAAHAHVNEAQYLALAEQAARDPDGFWAEHAKRITWMQAPTKIKNKYLKTQDIEYHNTISITTLSHRHNQSPTSTNKV